jgi:hypothetical protein
MVLEVPSLKIKRPLVKAFGKGHSHAGVLLEEVIRSQIRKQRQTESLGSHNPFEGMSSVTEASLTRLQLSQIHRTFGYYQPRGLSLLFGPLGNMSLIQTIAVD